jgi:hypothetical protein
MSTPAFVAILVFYTLCMAYPSLRLLWDAQSLAERITVIVVAIVEYVLVLALCVGQEWHAVNNDPPPFSFA